VFPLFTLKRGRDNVSLCSHCLGIVAIMVVMNCVALAQNWAISGMLNGGGGRGGGAEGHRVPPSPSFTDSLSSCRSALRNHIEVSLQM
jgi:hypothetical protein